MIYREVGMDWRTRITVDPEILVGKPVIKGTRLAVEFIIELLSNGWTYDQVLASYPRLTIDDIRACLAYAKDVLKQERVFPLADA